LALIEAGQAQPKVNIPAQQALRQLANRMAGRQSDAANLAQLRPKIA
jgi:hypothetical protein